MTERDRVNPSFLYWRASKPKAEIYLYIGQRRKNGELIFEFCNNKGKGES